MAMSRYYFDLDDGRRCHHDLDGAETDDLDEVRREAIAVLPDLAAEALRAGDHRVCKVQVRDTDNRVVFRATLTFEGTARANDFDLAANFAISRRVKPDRI
jgi:bifunctional DNase/RNase